METHEATVPAPEPSRYESYRVFLRDYFSYRKAGRGGFSYRLFSRLAGLSSPNFLHLVINGKRHVSREVARAVAGAMGLRGAQRAFFLALVQVETARSDEDKEAARKELLAATRQIVTRDLSHEQAQLLSRWHHMAIRELAFLPDFRPTGGDISRRLCSLVTPEEAEQSLRLLFRLGLLVPDENGVCRPKDVSLDTGDHRLQKTLMDDHHRQTLRLWSDNLTRINEASQERGLLVFPISDARLEQLRARLRTFQDELIGWLHDEPEPDRVVHLGLYLIPYAKSTKATKAGRTKGTDPTATSARTRTEPSLP